jgi:hypothetical protein|tara:strand:+ start:372 stop:614 length:243 start_codon:yes stop_codon:yes gene_type:complete
MSKTKSNVIDLLRHPKYLKKLITQKELEEKLLLHTISLQDFQKHIAHLEQLNKEVHKLNKRVEKKLDKLISDKNKPNGKK